MAADARVEIDAQAGRFIDVETERLRALGAARKDVQQMRLSSMQRLLDDDTIERFAELERFVDRKLTKALRQHPLWPWLKQFPGLGGAYTAMVIGGIGDPRRFPGQSCSRGHILPPGYEVGSPCPLRLANDPTESEFEDGGADTAAESEPRLGPAANLHESETRTGGAESTAESEPRLGPADASSGSERIRGGTETSDESEHQPGPADRPPGSEDKLGGADLLYDLNPSSGPVARRLESEMPDGEACAGIMLAPRRGTGVRSVWHYLGLHADENGCSPRKRKGQRASWDPRLRAAILMPDAGIAAQIVRHRVEPYRSIHPRSYERTKERLIIRERGVAKRSELVENAGPAKGEGVVPCIAREASPGPLAPFQIDNLARKIAVKAFIGDMLVRWKEIS